MRRENLSNSLLAVDMETLMRTVLRISLDSAKFLTNERKEIEPISRELSGMPVRVMDRSN